MNIEQALRKAFSLGQTYWAQADSESPKQWAKSAATEQAFEDLVGLMCNPPTSATDADEQPSTVNP